MLSMRRSRRRSFPREGHGLIRVLLAFFTLAALSSCGQGGSEAHHGWVLHSQVKFLAADFQVVSDPLPRSAFRLFFPYIAGDLYGPATTGDFIRPNLNADLSFDIDFGRVQQDLTRELQPTEFSMDYLKIDPADARIARLAPLALQPDGIDQVATVDWIDGVTHERLMLVYVDRPCRITGALVRNDYTVRYNVRAPSAGYIWIGRRKMEDGEQMYTEVAKPEMVYLALTPAVPAIRPPPPSNDNPPSPAPRLPDPANVPRKVALPVRTNTPAP
jgi:hypothetical protein